MAMLSEHGIRLSSMSPSFLNSNSTSHTWPFSAVAELIDNASDPGVSAKQIWIDVDEEAGHQCLTFIDNGSGMTPHKLHKMLSFGFTDKGSGKSSQYAIGVYGNGFKSGSMRLGRDALIFTKNGGCQTVGMLSQTYLENIKAQAVIVPIVPFNQQTKSLVVTEDSVASLAAILQHSIISSQEQLHSHFDSIRSKKGTKILIWNIRRAKDCKPEIDYETDATDFRLPDIQIEELKKSLRSSGSLTAENSIPEMHYSLRAYLSILYLKPRTQIILRGKKILATLVSKTLKNIEHDVYKPNFSKEKVKVTFGMNPKTKDHYGIMMYHRNRLIKAYEKVGCQLKASGQRAGVGVIGVIECNFLKPAHNKQDFEYTKEYRLTLGALGLKLNDYWKEVTKKKAKEREFQALERAENEDQHDADKGPMWLQCEECLKWRAVPASRYKVVPESWKCSDNPNPWYRSCSSPEEAEDSQELLTPSYQKTHKKREHLKNRKGETSLEVCGSQDQTAEHQTLSRSSSEPSQPTFESTHAPDHIRTAGRRRTEGSALEPDQTETDHPADHYTDTHMNANAQAESTVTAAITTAQQKPVGRGMVIKNKAEITHIETMTDENRLEDKETDKNKDTNMELTESGENTYTLSLKRKPGLVFYWEKKKPCLDSEYMAEETNPEKQPKTLSSEKTEQDSSSREKPSDAEKRIPASLTWTQPPPSTQTLMVSPLSRTEGPRSTPLPPQQNDRAAMLQKLADLKKEIQELTRLLGLETLDTMTNGDSGAEMPKRGTVTPPASTASREVGCQTDVAESSTSSSSPAKAPECQGLTVLDQRDVCGPKEQPEQNVPKETENLSWTRVSDSEACEDSRSLQEKLRKMRNNVVALLTVLLPQLDMSGISFDTSDVDNILQQIIEVNSLKMSSVL